MKFKALFAFFFMMLASCCANAAATPPGTGDENAKKNDLVGGVYNSETRKPLGNVTVTAFVSNSKEKSVLTDAAGSFSFNDLKPGTYKLVFEKEGFRKVTKEKYISRVDEALDLNILMEEHNAYDFTPGPSHFFDFD
ncbi:MAG: hypothetical protein JWP69_1594 [Flaviaesturariibacter sp.]|nr:hypothetical protein [Flaviaesturariibacter sp.]